MQGRHQPMGCTKVAIPLGQGQVFNCNDLIIRKVDGVAIPLGQGQVFNGVFMDNETTIDSRNPFGSGTGF